MRANRFLATPDSGVLLFQRLVLGCVMFPHGAQKVLGWFGGQGWSATMANFEKGLGLPAVIAAIAILNEFLGSISLITGAFARLGAFCISANMAAAVYLVHVHNGFFMNWMGNQKGEGFEYHLLALGLSLSLMVAGAGKWSIDRAIVHGDEPDAVTP
jgi:putative oxidoreductase